ncbi:hypothetical protein [Brevibacterium sp. HMSC07C04]|uniref:hypothetical protein n=1 Tax=Brevibacterium sp. HMSC07C04 TaxID=1581130 RepID=UPI0008A59BD2|nr:hypothetical protein [Brevibacterium sp. HMSC07C04]OFS25320.1 hypothetical protein HMPREF3162_08865 [Brevibacterium sp. HMSC07C04]
MPETHDTSDSSHTGSADSTQREARKPILAISAVAVALLIAAVGIRACEDDPAPPQEQQTEVDFLNHEQAERIVSALQDEGADVFQLVITRKHATAQIFEQDGKLGTLVFSPTGEPEKKGGGTAPADAARVPAADISADAFKAAEDKTLDVIDEAERIRSLSIEQDYGNFNGRDAGPSATLRAATSGEGFGTGSGTVVWDLAAERILSVPSADGAVPNVAQTDEAEQLLDTMPAVEAMAEQSGKQLVTALEYYEVKQVLSVEFAGNETRAVVLTKDDKTIQLDFATGAPTASNYTHSGLAPLDDWKKLADTAPSGRLMEAVEGLKLPSESAGAPKGAGAALFNADKRTPAPESAPSDAPEGQAGDATAKPTDGATAEDEEGQAAGEPDGTSESAGPSEEPTQKKTPDPVDMTKLPILMVRHHGEHGDVVFVDSQAGDADRPTKWALADGKPLAEDVQSAYWTRASQ